MAKILTALFVPWWRPLLFFLLSAGVFTGSNFTGPVAFQYLGAGLVLLSLGSLLYSVVLQIYQRRWLPALLTGLVLAGAFVLIFAFVVLSAVFRVIDGEDRWADEITIPGNIDLYEPAQLGMDDRTRPDSILNLPRTDTDFQLYNSFQPGLYHYDFWTKKIAPGVIYLKAYEVTQNYPLSVERLREGSAIGIGNASDTLVRVSTNSFFTIYEGDWGKPYAARFEVWYKPGVGGVERKLFEKIFRIEGWQR